MADINHSDLTSAGDLHEPKGASTAASGTVYVADGAGSGGFQTYPLATTGTPGIVKKTSAVADLTENSGAIGGTNDGNIPSLNAVSAGYVQAEVVAIRDGVRENADKINNLLAALRTAGIVT